MSRPIDTLRHKSFHQLLVEDFMHLAGQEVPTRPTMPSQEVRLLRAKLILEEALETIEALGFEPAVDFPSKLHLRPSGGLPSIVGIVDGCCDLKVVTTGTLSACGIDDAYMQHLIDQANLKKFGPGGYRREDGKWIKPPDWFSPDPQIVEHLIKTGYQP